MSREVIDDVPEAAGPVGAAVAPGVAEVTDLAGVTDLTRDPGLAGDTGPAHSADLDQHGSPASPVGAGSAGPGPAPGPGTWWRRPTRVGPAAGIAAVCLALGTLAGISQGRAAERHAALTATQIVIWPGSLTTQPGQQRVTGTLQVLSSGGAVRLSELKTDFGDFLFSPAQAVDRQPRPVTIDILADCSNAARYNLSTEPLTNLTGTAMVRDLPDDTPRPVRALLATSTVIYLMLIPCQDPSSSSFSSTTTQPDVHVDNLVPAPTGGGDARPAGPAAGG